MENWNKYFLEVYENFNKRNIDFVISRMTPNVKWANGMEGGFVYGQEGVKEYWTRQFELINPQVMPLEVTEIDGEIIIKVQQVVHDFEGKLLVDQVVTHVFKLEGNKIVQFDIGK